MADTQASVVAAERQVQIQQFQTSAAVKTAEGQAASRKLVADGEALLANLIREGRGKHHE